MKIITCSKGAGYVRWCVSALRNLYFKCMHRKRKMRKICHCGVRTLYGPVFFQGLFKAGKICVFMLTMDTITVMWKGGKGEWILDFHCWVARNTTPNVHGQLFADISGWFWHTAIITWSLLSAVKEIISFSPRPTFGHTAEKDGRAEVQAGSCTNQSSGSRAGGKACRSSCWGKRQSSHWGFKPLEPVRVCKSTNILSFPCLLTFGLHQRFF